MFRDRQTGHAVLGRKSLAKSKDRAYFVQGEQYYRNVSLGRPEPPEAEQRNSIYCNMSSSFNSNKLCAWRHNMPRPYPPVRAQAPRAPPSRRNVAVLSHAEYVPTLTAAAALRVKAALSKAAW